MSSLLRFEDLEIWQEGRIITKSVYQLTRDGSFSKDFALKDQIRRASISIVANIAEGFGRNANKEMVYFLSVAKGSAAEVMCLLYLALDESHIQQDKFDEVYERLRILIRKTGKLIQYLQNSPIKGSRYLRNQ